MQAAPRRVKTIYSVIASPQRLEILKILNVKGPLTYSALKTLAGFKSKKESGKFAYHLRKLVRQLLIQLNRQERKYTVTNLGRLVLNLTRQIEEQSLVESGKLYVRTTRQAMEEFNADKILQSLVKEAGMPVELAQRITSETESRLYKFQTQYLTAPLIREMVNSLLVEHNLEEYRHKLTRLGLPVYDVTQLLGKAGDDGSDVESLLHQTGKSVFSEYLLLEQIPRDVADAHLAGDIHIADAGSWGLTPDTIFVDLLSVRASGFNPKGRLPYAPMIPSPESLESAMTIIANITSLIRREASVEIVYRNFVQYLAPFARSKTKHEVVTSIFGFLAQASSQFPASQRPMISLELDPYVKDESGREVVERVLDATLDSYRALVEQVPRPGVRLVLAKLREDDSRFLKDAASIVYAGGRIAFFQSGQKRSFLGVNPDVLPPEFQGDHISVLHNLSLNLPRLSYDSNQDETYFRAKLAMLIGVASDALHDQADRPGARNEEGPPADPQLRIGGAELGRHAADNEPRGSRGGTLEPDQGPLARRQGLHRRQDPSDGHAGRLREVRQEREAGRRDNRGGGRPEAVRPRRGEVREGRPPGGGQAGLLPVAEAYPRGPPESREGRVPEEALRRPHRGLRGDP